MKQRHEAIILRWYLSASYKVALFDKTDGRLDAVMNAIQFRPGSLFSYLPVGSGGRTLVRDPRLIDVPLELAREDLLFVHHLLEMVFHFVPAGSSCEGVYDYLSLLYDASFFKQHPQRKKLLLFKMFVALGLHPEVPHCYQLVVSRLLAMPLNISENEDIDDECEHVLQQWLARCIAQHPAVHAFKTVQFLMHDISKIM